MKKVHLVVCVLVGLAGCASIVSGKTQPLTFNSNPEGAAVYVNGVKLGDTPVTVDVRRKEGTVITLTKEGYQDATLQPRDKMNPWVIGNVLFSWFSTIGSTVDYANDAHLEYTPDQFHTTLKPLQLTQLKSFNWNVSRTAFLLHRHDEIAGDIVTGAGENLDALLALLQVDGNDRRDAVGQIGRLLEGHRSPVAFAHAVLEAFPGEDPVLIARRSESQE